MFATEVYVSRRKKLKEIMKSGILLFPGNGEMAYNYKGNTYAYRQDSSFLYFFGLDQPGLTGVIDVDQGKDYVFGNDLDMDDIIWTGPQPTVASKSLTAGVSNSGSMAELEHFISSAGKQSRNVHYLPPYRAETFLYLEGLLGIPHASVSKGASVELIRAIASLRSVKEEMEIVEIEKMVDVAYEMHTAVMKNARPGLREKFLTGLVEGIASSYGYGISFPVILSIHGETLHNHHHGNILKEGDLLITDAGAESERYYASDITRTIPVSGKFSARQRDIYQIVLNANMEVIRNARPGVPYRDMHLLASRTIASGLKDLGLMKGSADDAVAEGAHALFMPHGLGHMLGLDVHDMENLGEDYIGYNEEFKRSEQFGTAYLRLAKRLEPGYVFTDEPGIYFIPELIHLWKKEKKFEAFIDYAKAESYIGFGGVRIEDDLLITSTGCRVLGKPIPKTIGEIESMMHQG